ncbi:MAG: hypothetical protein L0331_21755 [Chloroflexi bacterium]|nr:hypothetical protein [Chloroflexota bacterium]
MLNAVAIGQNRWQAGWHLSFQLYPFRFGQGRKSSHGLMHQCPQVNDCTIEGQLSCFSLGQRS